MIFSEYKDWRRVLRSDPCSYCGGSSEAIDHIDARRHGGSDSFDNWTPACTRCNSSKRTMPLLRYLIFRREPRPYSSYGPLISFKLPVDQIAFLRDRAKLNERTVSGEIRRLIREYQDAEDERAAA